MENTRTGNEHKQMKTMDKIARNNNMVILYNEGLSLRQIGDIVGLSSVSTVYEILKRLGANIRRRGSKDPGKETLLDLHITQGLRQTEIADLYEVTPVTVNRWLAKYKLREIDRKAAMEKDNE